MTGLLISLVVILGILAMISLVSLLLMMWWTTSSQGRHSIGAATAQAHREDQLAEMQRQTMAQAAEMVRQVAETAGLMATRAEDIVGIQARLTETLLLGRPMLETGPRPPTESESETSQTPAGELIWDQLPGPMQEAIIRDRTESSAWPDPSETLRGPSGNGLAEANLEDLLDPRTT